MKRHASPFILIVCFGALVAGVVQLMVLRFESGDVYPEYSSLRSDPLGTMVLYESLDALDGFTVKRDLSTTQLPDPSGSTYLHLATTVNAWNAVPPDALKKVEQFVRAGARLVITLFPESSRRAPSAGAKKPQPAKPEDEARTKAVSLWKQWGLTPRVLNLTLGAGDVFEPVVVSNSSGLLLPDSLEWHSGTVFENVDASWTAIYTRANDAVFVERRWGAGSVAIATDSFFLSNEAMQGDRHTELLSWMIGPNRTIIFDEAHLGVVEQGGVSAMMQRYRLQWFVAALLLLAGLFIWKNATSLAPAQITDTSETYIEGRDASSGFVNLLRRNIPARDILATCYTEWKKTAAQSGGYSAARLEKADAAFKTENSKTIKDRDPVATYRTIAGLLHKRDT
jgi:hypothetical protein